MLKAEVQHLKSKIVMLNQQKKALGFEPTHVQVDEILHRISVLEDRIRLLNQRV